MSFAAAPASGALQAGSPRPAVARRFTMGDLRSMLRAKITRRPSGTPAPPSTRSDNSSQLSNKSDDASSPTLGSSHAKAAETATAEPVDAAANERERSSHLHRQGAGPACEEATVMKHDRSSITAGQPPAQGSKAKGLVVLVCDAEGAKGAEGADDNNNNKNNNGLGQAALSISRGGAERVPDPAPKALEISDNVTFGSVALGISSASNSNGKSTTTKEGTAAKEKAPLATLPGTTGCNCSSDNLATSNITVLKTRTKKNNHGNPPTQPRVSFSHLAPGRAAATAAAAAAATAATAATTATNADSNNNNDDDDDDDDDEADDEFDLPTPAARISSAPALRRRQSLLSNQQTTLIRTLLGPGNTDDADADADADADSVDRLPPISANMVTRKIWVKRPGASPTMVTISEEDLVDDVRELILRKYGNSLGRHYDAPDLALRIVPREASQQERILGPEEPMARTLDAYYPGGQAVDEALIIDIPHRRTPRTSPRSGPPHMQHLTSVHYDDYHPVEGSDYFGPGAIAHMPVTLAGGPNAPPPSISVLNTGQVPQIPSPGGILRATRQYRDRPERPRLGRQHTSSPTVLNVVGTSGHAAAYAAANPHGMPMPMPGAVAVASQRTRSQSNASSDHTAPAVPPPILPAPALRTPPIQDSAVVAARTSSPRLQSRPKKKAAPPQSEVPPLPAGMLSGGVPPINVLIVEDNDINLRLLEAFVKRLKVRWQTAVNGREAVNKWRSGGFHLVLMDIQLPIMNGLEATREIRRLERVNNIGVLATPSAPAGQNGDGPRAADEIPEEDRLPNKELFKSPVIIVALTASSLQSDRHEALAAGCNDFLTKPVTYVWLERKLMEWGCMQALIDYEGWREWKSYSQQQGADGDDAAGGRKAKGKKTRAGLNSLPSDNP
ncbi:hypothetical protein VTJ83DRAFT_1547 [Remersonia thermophila]|uniref:Response regulatory domain-containing protein n=1 Tax=Remersonia thermophila TaxID=72144 RepID=A0ABR4DG79_9PEZI